MAKYRCLKQWLYQPPKVEGRDKASGELGLIAPKPILYATGDEVSFDGVPSETNLLPLDAEAEAKMAEGKELRAKQARDARLKQSEGGLDMLAALATALQNIQAGKPVGSFDGDANVRTPIDAGASGTSPSAGALSRATSSHGRKHASE